MINVFSGEHQHSIDAKGRVIVPAKFREMLGSSFYVTKGLDNNLLVYSIEEWTKLYEKLSTLPLSNKNSRAFSRFFLSSAEECEPDKQGRILISPALRDHAGLTKDVTVIGNGNKLEIWDTARWRQSVEEIDTEDMTEALFDMGIVI